MKNIIEQMEIFAVDPSVMNVGKSILMGHFTTKQKIRDQSKMDIMITTDGLEILSFSSIGGIDESKSWVPNEYLKESVQFIDSASFNFLMREQLKVYTSENPNIIALQICLLEIFPLEEGLHSYLFFGFTDSPFFAKNHSNVYFSDKDGSIKEGGSAIHKMGENLSSHFTRNFSFGFGKNLSLLSTSSRLYLEGIEIFKDLLLSDEEKTDEVKKDLSIVFSHNDKEYIIFLKKLNQKKAESGFSPKSKYWLTRKERKMLDDLSLESAMELR